MGKGCWVPKARFLEYKCHGEERTTDGDESQVYQSRNQFTRILDQLCEDIFLLGAEPLEEAREVARI